MEIQNPERRKPSFTKRIGRKCRLIKTLTEQNNDHTQIMHKIQFRSSFNDICEKEFFKHSVLQRNTLKVLERL